MLLRTWSRAASIAPIALVLAWAAPAPASAPATTGLLMTEFPAPKGTAPADIAASPDGRTLWVTLIAPPTGNAQNTDAVNSIGRFDTATGAMSVVKLPTPGEPVSLAVAADGRVYVSQLANRYPPAPVLQVFNPATRTWGRQELAYTPAELLAAGGRVWFIAELDEDPNVPGQPPVALPGSLVHRSRLFSIDAAGTITKHVNPDTLVTDGPRRSDYYTELHAGPDGAIWLGGGTGLASGRGLLSRFEPTPNAWAARELPSSFLREIAVSPLGHVWWSAHGGSEAPDALFRLPSFGAAGPDVRVNAAFSFNSDLAIAADGSLIAVSLNGAIRVDGGGRMTAFALPGSSDTSSGELAQAAGALWVVRPAVGTITKISLGTGASSSVRQAVTLGINASAECAEPCTVSSQIVAPAPAVRGASAAATRRPVVIATGRASRKAAGFTLIRNRYNAAGRRALRGKRRLRLEVRLTVRYGARIVRRSRSKLTIRG